MKNNKLKLSRDLQEIFKISYKFSKERKMNVIPIEIFSLTFLDYYLNKRNSSPSNLPLSNYLLSTIEEEDRDFIIETAEDENADIICWLEENASSLHVDKDDRYFTVDLGIDPELEYVINCSIEHTKYVYPEREDILDTDVILEKLIEHYDSSVIDILIDMGITSDSISKLYEGEKKIKGGKDIMSALMEIAKSMAKDKESTNNDNNSMANNEDDEKEFEKYGDTSPLSGQELDPNSDTPYLDQFSINMNNYAKDGKYDPVIGRDALVDSIIEILCKRKKANVALVGEAGVGKSSVVELLAQRIVNNKVPAALKNKEIRALNLNDLVAGTKYRGEYEERLQKIIKEVCSSKDIIVYIDELHALVGNGGTGGGDGANILKPYLARGEFQCIGATTNDEYRKYIEKDAALNRRFTQVEVKEPSKGETIKILKGLSGAYEKYHRVRLDKDTIEHCVEWADRYITDKNFPDKAIDVLDLSSSIVSLKRIVESPKTTDLEDKLKNIIEEKIKAVQVDMDFERGEELRKEEKAIQKLIDAEIKATEKDARNRKTWPVITLDAVSDAVSKMTGIPAENIIQSDRDKIALMKKELESKVIGQQEAIDTLVQSLQLNSLGLHNQKKPLCSLLAVGPSGVGKTLIAQEFARIFFGSEDALIKIDGGELKEEHSLSKLIGAPAGYVGYENGDCILEKVRRHKRSLVLLDEIDKMHPALYDIWLSVLETSKCKLANGTEVDFSNCVIIFTGNIGTRELKEDKNIGFGIKDPGDIARRNKNIVMKSVEKHFRPEFINRLDKIIVFNNLGKDELVKIFNKELLKIRTQLNKNKVSIKVSNELRDYIISKCNPIYGARDLSRGIESSVIIPVSNMMLQDVKASKFNVSLDENNNPKVEVLG